MKLDKEQRRSARRAVLYIQNIYEYVDPEVQKILTAAMIKLRALGMDGTET